MTGSDSLLRNALSNILRKSYNFSLLDDACLGGKAISDEIKIEYCPTGEMRGDFFTKPLQGGLFLKFRKEILNL